MVPISFSILQLCQLSSYACSWFSWGGTFIDELWVIFNMYFTFHSCEYTQYLADLFYGLNFNPTLDQDDLQTYFCILFHFRCFASLEHPKQMWLWFIIWIDAIVFMCFNIWIGRCYARLHPRAVNCRKKKCGHSNQVFLLCPLFYSFSFPIKAQHSSHLLKSV